MTGMRRECGTSTSRCQWLGSWVWVTTHHSWEVDGLVLLVLLVCVLLSLTTLFDKPYPSRTALPVVAGNCDLQCDQ